MKGWETLSRFNLLDEPWISVIIDEKGNAENVSLKTFFKNAHQYKRLAGDSKTQDFAVMRVLLAICHTVFSRFDDDGTPHNYLELDDNFRQITEVSEEDCDDYCDALFDTWENLWTAGSFPPIVNEYLEKWHKHFYLFDDDYPFFQVKKEDISKEKINRTSPTTVLGKNINRLISESGNKLSLFSPKFNSKKNKEILTAPEIARWLITFHNYTGQADKTFFDPKNYSPSKGWLYDIGGIVLEGHNLFQTLLLNCVLVHPVEDYQSASQKPCWEASSDEVIKRSLDPRPIDNLSELYTAWSRAIYIDPNTNVEAPFSFEIVKLPDINHQNQFLEPMTLWRYNKKGINKNTFTPRKHLSNQSLWRSFGLLTLPFSANEQRKPDIISWLQEISTTIGDFNLTLHAISMKDDGNATSWVPTDEICDELRINDLVLTDIQKTGWVPRINDVVEDTKKIIGFTFRIFITDIKEIRNISSTQFVNQKVEELYFAIDHSFRDWLSSIKPADSKDKKIFEWNRTLKNLALSHAKTILQQAGPQDYIGITVDNQIKNIATAYNRFTYFLNQQIQFKEGDHDRNP